MQDIVCHKQDSGINQVSLHALSIVAPPTLLVVKESSRVFHFGLSHSVLLCAEYSKPAL